MRQKERPKKNIHRRAKERPADIHPSPSEDSLSISSSTTSLTLGDLSVHDSIQLPTATEDVSKSIESNLVREKVSPLVTYDIKQEEHEKIFFLISLVEQTYGVSSVRLCWLRLAILCERTLDLPLTTHLTEDENDSPDAKEISRKEMPEDLQSNTESFSTSSVIQSEILCYIPNQYGMLMAPAESEWIDLFAINAEDYYMTQYLEKNYQFLLERIKPIDAERIEYKEKKYYKIFMEFKKSKIDIPEDILAELKSPSSNFSNQRQLHMHETSPSAAEATKYTFDEYLKPIKGRIRLNRNYRIPYCNVLIFARLNFRNRFGSEHQEHTSTIRSVANNRDFQETMKVSDIDLRIEPIIADNYNILHDSEDEIEFNRQIILPLGEMNIDITALRHILKDERNNDLEEVLHESLEDPKCFQDFITTLTGMFRLEYSDRGVQYAVAGGFTSPLYTSYPWPDRDINCDCDGMNLSDDVGEEDTDDEEERRNTSDIPITSIER
eukprot:CAMPEP_0173141962 /NCGR_PEP_ID=MMETSP1105-20130129/5811_1 /TAXON_ID=2985 /ORGANISM="Ochromonas sp., Strain BG-1" /LENGTH=494 /DNA_ID=CAMNT_0014055275 /DNA_START=69 /DNA_END=1553 /DNA_ORIENTATION=+